jgi:hypothetical protein
MPYARQLFFVLPLIRCTVMTAGIGLVAAQNMIVSFFMQPGRPEDQQGDRWRTACPALLLHGTSCSCSQVIQTPEALISTSGRSGESQACVAALLNGAEQGGVLNGAGLR